MKRVLFALIGLLAVACVGKETRTTKVIAHRGFWQAEAAAPQNSVASLENSIALGCFGTEFDIWLTADTIPVLYHDPLTSAGTSIQDVTYAELTATGETLSNGEKIPTLGEFLAVWKESDQKVKLILEIKNYQSTPEHDALSAKTVHEAVLASGITSDKLEYIAFGREVCKALTALNSGFEVAYLSGDLSPADAVKELGVTGIDYNGKVLKEHPEWIAAAQEMGLTVNVWTINKEADMQLFVDAGVDYITTDKPDVLMEILASQNKN
jgi:glycerophosphoryl diester phosphodiesterase